MKWFGLLAAGWMIGGCAKGGVPEDAVEEMPARRTHGEEVRLAIAKELLESGNTLGALDIVRQMRSEGFDGPELDFLQGKALRLDGVTSEAERLLQTAQKRMPKDARPSAELCVLYADLQQVEKAIERCKRATEIDSSNGGAWNNLGFLLLSAARPAEALEAAERAIDLDGAEPRFRNNLAMAQAALGREDQAFRTLQSTMSRADAAYMVGVVLERFVGLDGARSWYEKALAIDPDHPEARSRTDLSETAETPLEPTEPDAPPDLPVPSPTEEEP